MHTWLESYRDLWESNLDAWMTYCKGRSREAQ